MRRHLFLPLVWVGLLALLANGCGGALTMSQRLAGEWVGRPETVVDRTVREWPGRAGGEQVSAETPEVAEAISKAPVSDLEATAPEVVIQMKLGELGKATLSLDGEQPLTGRWSLTPLDGRRAQLEIEVEASSEAPIEESKSVRRRFDLEFFKEGEAFTLREQSADRRFGRLVFRRSGDSGKPAEKPAEEPAAAEPTDADPSNS